MMATTCASGTLFDTRLAVYSSGISPGDCSSLSCVTANDDMGIAGGCMEANGNTLSKVDWPTTPGITYYIYLDGFGTTTGTYELYVEETAPAPISLVKFEGRVEGDINKLFWETQSETNTEWHVIERSVTGNGGWEELDREEAAGFSSLRLTYEMEDEDAYPVTYYRLKTINYDRSTTFSPIIRIEREEGGFQLQRLAPMPFNDLLEIQYESDRNGTAVFSVYDFAGKEVFREKQEVEDGANRVYLDLDWLEAGVYLLILEQEGRRVNERIVKQKS